MTLGATGRLLVRTINTKCFSRRNISLVMKQGRVDVVVFSHVQYTNIVLFSYVTLLLNECPLHGPGSIRCFEGLFYAAMYILVPVLPGY